MLDVEAALAWALAEVGLIPKRAASQIAKKASISHVRLERVKELESQLGHDIMAMVEALAEVCGEAGKYVHYGATSYDIVDTAMGLQLREALNILEARLSELEEVLIRLVKKYKRTLMVGRTHGQHALPITLGLKFAVWLREISRHLQRLHQCRDRIVIGKLTGAVGTQAGFGPEGLKVQRLVMEKLGLKPVEVSTQIVQRDRHAELVCLLAVIASTLDKFATEIRELQRTEIGELAEPFQLGRQVGSSTMPHKVNPVRCERICALAKIVRSLTIPALENVVSWQERDLSNSAAERFLIPEALILTDYMVDLMAKVLRGLRVDEQRMRENLELTRGRVMSEAVMLALTRKGMGRQEAHKLLRELTVRSLLKNEDFRQVLLKSEAVRQYLSVKEIEEALKPENYLGTTLQQIDEVLKQTLKERENRAK
ncbi:TPA: adenylosuccinate lyase, partial [Candidatus Bathyarchaeota archaeon]|nr:adenylosuccinate lyase [Candidatus Bathyarchaeota archaeon]